MQLQLHKDSYKTQWVPCRQECPKPCFHSRPRKVPAQGRALLRGCGFWSEGVIVSIQVLTPKTNCGQAWEPQSFSPPVVNFTIITTILLPILTTIIIIILTIITIIISPESRNLVHLRLSVQQLCLKCSQHWFHLLYSTQLTLNRNFDMDSKNYNMILVQFENLEKHWSLRHFESSLWQRLDIVCCHLRLTDSPAFWSWCWKPLATLVFTCL